MYRLYTPGRIVFGTGTYARTIKICDLVVASPSMADTIEDLIDGTDIDLTEFKRSSPTGEPTEEDIEDLADLMKATRPHCIAAIGGGSVIDAVKLARVLYDTGLENVSDLYMGVPMPENMTHLIGIETTSGTGTGVSSAAVVMDHSGIKHGLVGEALICDKAVYDPQLVMDMPREVAANSGMDALTHAIEAYTSTIDNIPADTMALKAVEIIGENLESSVLGNPKAREMMHYANMMAGIGFANSRLGLCHALSHKIGGRFSLPHGKVNAMLLPYVVSFNMPNTDRYRDVARALGLKSAEELVDWLKGLNNRLGIPAGLSGLGKEFEDIIPAIAEEASADALMKSNPRTASTEEIEALLRESFSQ